MAKELDIIVFGATGFTGKHALPYVHKLSTAYGRNFSWGIAGRSETKLKEVAEKTKKDLAISGDIPIIIADVQNEESLKAMARKTRLVINCCGPYRFYGEQVIKACIEEGTHQVDITGETEYMEGIELLYHEAAKEKGVYIISACGLDSLPIDLGVLFLQEKFDGTVNSVQTYLTTKSKGSGPVINYGTWKTAVHSLATMHKLKEIRRKLYPTRLPTFRPKLQSKFLPHTSPVANGWALPFLGSDRAVIRRTQRYLYEVEGKRPAQIETYFTVKSFGFVIIFAIMGLMFSTLAKFSLGRKLLLRYPGFFSGGMFGKEEPSEETIQQTEFTITLYGEGWKEKLAEPSDQFSKPIDKTVTVQVKGTNPGYGATNLALTMAGLTILTETEKLPSNGGVYAPGAVFANTKLIEKLNENGLTFEILEIKNLN